MVNRNGKIFKVKRKTGNGSWELPPKSNIEFDIIQLWLCHCHYTQIYVKLIVLLKCIIVKNLAYELWSSSFINRAIRSKPSDRSLPRSKFSYHIFSLQLKNPDIMLLVISSTLKAFVFYYSKKKDSPRSEGQPIYWVLFIL